MSKTDEINQRPWTVQRSEDRRHTSGWFVERDCDRWPRTERLLSDGGRARKFKSEAAAQLACDKANTKAAA